MPNLARALLKVARNKGAAGVDGRSVEEVIESARLLLPKLRHALLSGRYEPGEIRRVWIPKPGGQGQRGLRVSPRAYSTKPPQLDRGSEGSTSIFEP